jgi:hypothetical protein
LIAALAAHDVASAQTTADPGPSKWDIEVHAGIAATHSPVAGSAILPTTGAIVQGEISASTFYLGDGARLFNQNLGVVTGAPAASLIVPLDAVLLGASTTREIGPAIGVRLQRAITNRLAVQVDGDLSLDHLAFKPEVLTAIEAARASYATALSRALSVSPLTSAVSSVATISDHQFAPQLFATGALVFNLKTSGKVIPYVLGGAGVVFNGGNTPSATLVANYSLDKPAQLLGTDAVTITYGEDGLSVLGLGGGGFTYDLSPRWGIRVDAREYLYKNSATNTIDISPTLGFQSTGQSFPVVDVGALKFATASPLNGTPVSAFPTFTGTGIQGHLTVSAGFFLRF